MKNTLADLNNHLFAQLERLSDDDLKADKLQEEIQKSKMIVDISSAIISNASLELKNKELHLDAMRLLSQGQFSANVEKHVLCLIENK